MNNNSNWIRAVAGAFCKDPFFKLYTVENLQMYHGFFLKYLKYIHVFRILLVQHVRNHYIGLPTYFIIRCNEVTARNDQ